MARDGDPGVDGDGPRPTFPSPPDPDTARARRGRAMRRVVVVVLVAFLAGAAFNLYGVKTTEAAAQAGGYRLTVTYASVSRPGLATPWEVEVQREGGFDSFVTLATTAAYLDVIDENSLDPEPISTTSDGERMFWTFEAPPGDTLSVSIDGRIEPGVQLRRVNGTTSVLDADESPVVSVRYRTFVTP